jgi:hypothetical protein
MPHPRGHPGGWQWCWMCAIIGWLLVSLAVRVTGRALAEDVLNSPSSNSGAEVASNSGVDAAQIIALKGTCYYDTSTRVYLFQQGTYRVPAGMSKYCFIRPAGGTCTAQHIVVSHTAPASTLVGCECDIGYMLDHQTGECLEDEPNSGRTGNDPQPQLDAQLQVAAVTPQLNPPSPAEFDLCVLKFWNAFKCRVSRDMAIQAETITSKYFHTDCSFSSGDSPLTCDATTYSGMRPVCQRQGNGNAFQHAYWNAMMSFFQGWDWAKTVADAHENNEAYSTAVLDMQMDYDNNARGRSIMSGFSVISNRAYTFEREKTSLLIARHVQRAVNSGKMVRLVRYGGSPTPQGSIYCPTCRKQPTSSACGNTI